MTSPSAERPPEPPPDTRRRWLLAGLRLVLPLAMAAFVAVLFGLLSWYFWVILLFPVVLGAAIGWAVAFGVVALSGRRGATASLAVFVLAGFTLEQVFEDHHQRRAFAETLFIARAASSGMSPDKIASLREVSGTDFLARDADEQLDSQVEARLGFGGPLGRFASRLDAGVRLGGPYIGGRGLELGLPGGLAVLALELALALLIASRVARAAQRSTGGPPSGHAASDPSLDQPPGPG